MELVRDGVRVGGQLFAQCIPFMEAPAATMAGADADEQILDVIEARREDVIGAVMAGKVLNVDRRATGAQGG